MFFYINFLISPPLSISTDHENDENKDIKQNDNETENCHESVENAGIQQIQQHQQQPEQDNKANEQIANDTNEARDTIDKNPIKQQEATTISNRTSSSNEETLQMEEEQKLKKQKVSYYSLPKIGCAKVLRAQNKIVSGIVTPPRNICFSSRKH